MPWQPLPRIAFAVATYPFAASSPADLPLEIGDELYIIEETADGAWLRGYLVAPPSLLAGLTSVRGATLEARVFSGIFPRSCVEVREMLGEGDEVLVNGNVPGHHQGVAGGDDSGADEDAPGLDDLDSGKAGLAPAQKRKRKDTEKAAVSAADEAPSSPAKGKHAMMSPLGIGTPTGIQGRLSVPVKREPGAERPPAPVPMLKIGDETPTSASEPLIDEIASCLREWHSTNLHGLLLARQYGKLDRLSQLITTLNLARQQFLHNVLTTHEYVKLRERTVWDLVRVNKLCGGEVIVRDPRERGRVLTGDDSAVEITRLQSIMSLLDEPPRQQVELNALHHLLVDVRGFATSASAEAITLVLYLVARPAGEPPVVVSENFTIQIPSGGSISNLAKAAQMRTLFTDLSSQDIGDVPAAESDLYLVVKVRASQQVVSGKPGSRSGGSASQGMTPFSKDPTRAPSTAGTKASRRSLMWGSKGSRAGFSRGGPVSKLDALSEQPEEKQAERTAAEQLESRDGGLPPSTAGSRGPASPDGALFPGLQTMADRTVGIGVLKLNSIMKQDEEVEHVISIWSPSARFQQDQQDGESWDTVIPKLLESRSGQYERSRRAERVQVHLKSFVDPDADALIKATPTMLSGISKTSKMGFSGAPTKPRSDIYVTIDEATLNRQNLLSRFGGSATALPSSLQGNNLQITMEVRRASGERIESSIYDSSNTEPLSTWKSVAAERGEPWSQHLRLSLAPQDVPGAHLVMFVADIPNPPFAVAHMPLWDQQAFVRDGTHSLLLYKVDEHTSTAQPQPTANSGTASKGQAASAPTGGYLSLPWSARGRDEHSADVTGPLATLKVETYLCSTRFSQDRVVLGLLRWKEQPRDEVPNLLRQLVFVPEIEVVKLLSDVLDALFGILVDHSGNDEYEDLVFTALVRVLGIVHDRRFNLGPLVDQYAENKFNYPFATSCLVRSFTRLLSKPTEPETARKLRATFKVVRHILKFITHARDQQKEKEAGIGITSTTPGFTRHLRSIFKALDAMMRNTAPVLVGSQTLAVQHFHTWLPELTGLLTTEEITHIAIDFMESCANVKGKLVLYKLVLIINYAKLDLFSHPEQRAALSANTVRWIAPHWGRTDEVTEQWKEQVRLCCSVLASQVDHLGPEIPDYVPKLLDSYLAIQATPQRPKTRLSLLFPTQYPFPMKPIASADQQQPQQPQQQQQAVCFDEALVELSALLSTLSNSPSGMQLELASEDLNVLLEKTLRVHMSILEAEAFPANWLSVQIYHHKSTMRTLQYVGGILLDSFLPHPDEAENFSTELWKMFFVTLLRLVGSSSLALETFPEQKRRAVWKIAGDVREHGAELLRRTWEAIGWETSPDERARFGLAKMGGYQVQYVPTLVGPIVELCLSVHEGLRRMAVEVLQTMIVSEWTLSEDLSVIQTEMIDCLDRFFKSKPLTESMLQKLFVAELLDRFQPLSLVPDEPLYAALRELMATVDEFLDLLVAVHSGDAGEASNLIHRLRLMEFLRDMQKEEIFVRYVHQLATLQAEARNHTEAGLALRLHADLYEWDPIRTTPALVDPDFPSQTHFERKERIYFDMIKHFEEGEAWSSALAAYKDLQVQYETNVFDFAKLARTERAIANIYETIGKSDKLVPRYFKVVYKGLGFSASLRDKEFVFEGSPTERTSAFTDRMQEQYPNARIVASGDADDVEDAEGQYLIISTLSPHRDLSHPAYRRARVPPIVRDYLLTAHPQVFSVSTRRNTSGPVTEHVSEKMVYTTAEPFPTILRRSEVVSVRELRLGAKETALERIVRKTQEMAAVERRLAEGDDDVARLLVDAVAVSVNAESENSIVCYRQLLPRGGVVEAAGEDDDGTAEPAVQLDDQETAIKMALVDHAIMIKRCLATFGRSSNEILTSRHEELQKRFEETFAPEIALFTPPPPVRDLNASPSPTWRRSSPSTDPNPPQQNIATALMTNGHATTADDQSSPASAAASSAVSGGRLGSSRGNRLSFLGGRRRDNSTTSNGEPSTSADAGADGSSRRRSSSKDNAHRRSFFRSHSVDTTNENNGTTGSDWGTEHASGGSSVAAVKGGDSLASSVTGSVTATNEHARHQNAAALHSLEGVGQQPPLSSSSGAKRGVGSVRKRLSLLKLGGGGEGKKLVSTHAHGGGGRGNGTALSGLDEE